MREREAAKDTVVVCFVVVLIGCVCVSVVMFSFFRFVSRALFFARVPW